MGIAISAMRKIFSFIFLPHYRRSPHGSRLLDDLIRLLEHADRNCQTDLFGSLEINDEFKLRRLLHRQISRFGTFQNLVHVTSRTPIEVSAVYPVGHETAFIDILLLWVDS